MSGLPKSYIKKYGISKRAWTEYRKSKGKGKGSSKKSGKSNKRASPKSKSRRRGSSMRLPKIQNDLMNGLSVTLAKFVAGVVPISLPYGLENQGAQYVLGVVAKNPDWKKIAKANAIDAVASGFLGGVNVGAFSGSEWL